jgi:UDP-3-O-[3-hydroxymyristoyl] N-acetylglucosamine deacetylase
MELRRGPARAVGAEHLLAACYGLGICCLSIELDRGEVPGLDGSAQAWVDAMDRAGVAPCGGWRMSAGGRSVTVGGTDGPRIEYHPGDTEALEILYRVDYRHHGGGVEELSIRFDEVRFRNELASARTFAVRGVDGGPLPGVPARALWTDSPAAERRFPDELLRHKVLDLLGDLALVGRPIAGRVVGDRAGHRLHQRLAAALSETC